jgi:hypothetical protein
MPDPLFRDFQDQVFEESQVFFSGQQGKCPLSTLRLLFSYLLYSMYKFHVRSKLARTYARNYKNLIDYSLETP